MNSQKIQSALARALWLAEWAGEDYQDNVDLRDAARAYVPSIREALASMQQTDAPNSQQEVAGIELTDAEIDSIDRNTHFHESPDWIYRFARAVIAADRTHRADADPNAPCTVPDVDWLAQVIRRADGRHTLGAADLAEHIIEAMIEANGSNTAHGAKTS